MTHLFANHVRCRSGRSIRKDAAGFTLVEFLVAVAIGMVIVIAASYVYLSTRDSQRTLSEKAYMFENARFAMEVIGRDIENAGFYPAIRVGQEQIAAAEVVADTYTNPCLDRTGASNALCTFTAPAAFNAPVFGCAGQRLQRSGSGATSAYACAAHPASGTADTLVLNYYTNDAEGLDLGQRADCQRQDVAIDPLNELRRHANFSATAAASRPFLLPRRPLFVTNAYTLQATTVQQEGRTVNTNSLACNGNGNDDSVSTVNVYQPIVQGIEQLRFTYLTRMGGGNSRYLATASVTDWTAVMGVQVCVMARSMENTKISGPASYSLTDCYGVSQSYTDGVERKVYTQVFALKNVLNE